MNPHIFLRSTTVLAALLLVVPSLSARAGVDISVGGTTNLAPLLIQAAAAYENSHPGVTISVSSTSSGAGIASLKKHDIDIAMSDVAVDDVEFGDNVLGSVGFAFVANKDCGIKNLAREQLIAIFSGKVTNWKDAGGSDRRIALIGREIGTGTRFVFEDNVAKTTIPIRVEANATAVLNAVASTSGALGYLASGFLGNHQDLLVAYQGVMPTPVTIRTREYRFSTSEHLYTYKNPRPDVAAFVQYVESSTDQLRANGIY
ncbi:MAG: substrate-binding domain-containing protein [Candidatus Aquilonibacter sp.]